MIATVIDKLLAIPAGFWTVLSQMAPYLLFGFLVAGVLSVFVSARLVERHLGGRGFASVVKATLFGIPLPLCSCGVIPVSAGLRRHGAGKGATVGFLLSTPQTGVDSILVTWGLLGWVFAIFRPLVALVSGLVGGTLTDWLAHHGTTDVPPEICTESCCTPNGQGRLRRTLEYGFVTLPRDIGRSLLIGLAAAALITAVVPQDYFGQYLGTAGVSGIVSILVLMALGIPVYVCATASVPVAYALIAGGVPPGAAFAFLVTGPATNAATLAVVSKVLGKRTAVIYLLTVAATAVGGGLLLNQLVSANEVAHAHGLHQMLPGWLEHVSAVVLLAVLGVGIFYRPSADRQFGHDHDHEHDHPHTDDRHQLAPGEHAGGSPDGTPASSGEDAAELQFRVDGMTCSHCAASVQRALSECPGVQSAEVDLKGKRATVNGHDLDPNALRLAVEGLGYRVTHTKEKEDGA